MPETRGGYRPPNTEVERTEKGYHVPPELLAAILAAVISCAGSEKRITDETVVPGTAQVEAREKKFKSDAVYDLLRKEVAEIDPEKLVAFEAILEDEALRHLQNKFSSQEDIRRNKNDYVYYTKNIEKLFGTLKNEARREEIFAAIARHCEKNNVPFEIALAVMANENGGRSGPVSYAGAQGLMQVMPNTARDMGVSESQMRTIDGQVKAGVRALAAYYKKFGQWGVALVAYNGGSGDIAKFLIKHKFLPKKHYMKSMARNFAANPEDFYNEEPDIVAMYEKSVNKPALGYPFRVIALSRVFTTIDWGGAGKPFSIKKDKLPYPEFWDKRKGVEIKSGDSGVKKTKRQPARINKQKILASTWKRQRR
jgi:hypothetical protein